MKKSQLSYDIMQSRKILEHLEDLAKKLDVEIIYEKLGNEDFSASGGLCKINGDYKIFLDRSGPLKSRIEILSQALCSFDREKIYLVPRIREILEKAEGEILGTVKK